ncbi:hypothetical protein DFH06DRAFT_1143127 [Mycena polygramma]|nr:hypothetical protein DFH06DRAFT_1143127 [Mycena polygramma]
MSEMPEDVVEINEWSESLREVGFSKGILEKIIRRTYHEVWAETNESIWFMRAQVGFEWDRLVVRSAKESKRVVMRGGKISSLSSATAPAKEDGHGSDPARNSKSRLGKRKNTWPRDPIYAITPRCYGVLLAWARPDKGDGQGVLSTDKADARVVFRVDKGKMRVRSAADNPGVQRRSRENKGSVGMCQCADKGAPHFRRRTREGDMWAGWHTKEGDVAAR